MITGPVTKTQAGPAVVFSFIIAALATFLSGNLTTNFAVNIVISKSN